MKLPIIQPLYTTNEAPREEQFNPIIHASEDFREVRARKGGKCKCGETNPDNFYKYTARATGAVYILNPCKKCYKLKNKKRYGRN